MAKAGNVNLKQSKIKKPGNRQAKYYLFLLYQ